MSASNRFATASAAEIARFDEQSMRWWDRDGPSRALHDLNPERMAFARECLDLRGKRVLDLGCGGGILSEALAAAGADVLGIDVSPEQIEVARLHALESGSSARYEHSDAAAIAQRDRGHYDAICCMEMLEHVEQPEQVLQICADLLKPGGLLLLSTIDRNWLSYALAIVLAERVLKLLPAGTHRHDWLIRPSEMAAGLRAAGLLLRRCEGLHYDPFRRRAWRSRHAGLNYVMLAEKPVEA